MTQSKHTKGSWYTDGQMILDDARGNLVCSLPETSNDHHNARLIAAAPELLEALEECRDKFYKSIISSGTDEEFALISCEKYDAIIAKAKGE